MFSFTRLLAWLRLCCLALLFITHNALADSLGLSLDKAVSNAINNPSIQAAKAKADAMATLPSQLGSLPDPVISIGLANAPVDSFSTSQEAMTQWQLGISQAIPFPGKRQLRADISDELSQAAAANSHEIQLTVEREVKKTWWQLFYLDRALEVININQTLLRQFIDIADTKYRVGQGLQQDVLLAQLELSKLLDKNIELSSAREQQQARLNTLMGQAPNQVIKLPSKTAIDFSLKTLRSYDEFAEIAQQRRPLLQQQRLLIAAADKRKQLAEKSLMPDFNLSAKYGMRQGENPDGSQRADLLSLQLGVTVPLFADSKQKMAISQRNKERVQQGFELQDRWLAVQNAISDQISAYNRAKQQYQLLNTGIVPQAQQTVASMLAAYQVNKVDFLNLIRAQITLYNYETTSWLAITQAKIAAAELAATIGEDNLYD